MHLIQNEDILMMDLRELRQLNPKHVVDPISGAAFDHIFNMCRARWQRDNSDPNAPHAALTAGGCSDGFVDTPTVLSYSNLCELMAIQMVRLIRESGVQIEPGFDWIIGSDHASAAFSGFVARHFGARYDFTEKGPNKTQLWPRQTIDPDVAVFQVEELATTTATFGRVRKGVREGNRHPVTFAEIAYVLVHRSSEMQFEGNPLLYVRHYDIRSWDSPAVCDLCKAGSKRIEEPKKNWAELTGKTR